MVFLRKVRRKLIVSGKFKTYLLYAAGEIILIVLGILIAWKINDLNEIRKNHIVEAKIYKSLQEELDSNLQTLDSALLKYSNSVSRLGIILNTVGEDEENITQEQKNNIVQVQYSEI